MNYKYKTGDRVLLNLPETGTNWVIINKEMRKLQDNQTNKGYTIKYRERSGEDPSYLIYDKQHDRNWYFLEDWLLPANPRLHSSGGNI